MIASSVDMSLEPVITPASRMATYKKAPVRLCKPGNPKLLSGPYRAGRHVAW